MGMLRFQDMIVDPVPESSQEEHRGHAQFNDAEAAWLWAARCLDAARYGRRPAYADRVPARPCSPLDVVAAADLLIERGKIDGRVARLLAASAKTQMAPAFNAQWIEAMGVLDDALMQRGWVARTPAAARSVSA